MSADKRTDVAGKLSSRVMNMKFMKHAEQAEEEKEALESQKKLVDSSEWRIDGGADLLRKHGSRTKVAESVGFSQIRAMTQSSEESGVVLRSGSTNPGRRVFGRCSAQEEMPETKKRSLEDLEEDGVSTMDLEELWEASKNKKKSQDKNKNKKKAKKNAKK